MAASERTPLLVNGRASSPEDAFSQPPSPVSSTSTVIDDVEHGFFAKLQDDDDKPMPKFQIFLLCLARVMEPLAFFSIIPYIAQMVQRNGDLSDSDIGFYSGLIESLFSLTQAVVLMFWGRMSDRFGRKPLLVISVLGMSLLPVLFNMSTTIPQMIFYRSLAGIFAFSNLIVRTMIGEHCTTKTQPTAFSWFSTAGNIGLAFGPMVGGLLADPIDQFPSLFGGSQFFEKYPYSLPGFVLAAFGLVIAVLVVVYVEETLDVSDSMASGGGCKNENQTTILELLRAPMVANVLFIYCSVSLVGFALSGILPVMLFTPIEIGGWGLSTFQISLFMSGQGISEFVWLLFLFPVMQRRCGTKAIMKLTVIGMLLFFTCYSGVNFLLRDDTVESVVLAWLVGGFIFVIGPMVWMGFTGAQLALNDACPSPRDLSLLNAVADTCCSIVRAFTPGVASAVYALGVRDQILGGQLGWAVLYPFAIGLWLAVTYLPEHETQNKSED